MWDHFFHTRIYYLPRLHQVVQIIVYHIRKVHDDRYQVHSYKQYIFSVLLDLVVPQRSMAGCVDMYPDNHIQDICNNLKNRDIF